MSTVSVLVSPLKPSGVELSLWWVSVGKDLCVQSTTTTSPRFFPVASYGTNAATLDGKARMSQRLTTRRRMNAKAAYAHAQASLPSSDKAPASSNIHDTSTTAIAGDRRDEKCVGALGVATVKGSLAH